MIRKEDISFLIRLVFSKLNFCESFCVLPVEESGVYVAFEGKEARIGAADKTLFARGLVLLIRELRKGKQSIYIHQKPHFAMRGVHLDMSRGAAMRTESIKKYMETLAMLGLNTFFMYMEDMYEVSGHPLFGYKRGRYIKAELKEIDAYGKKLGIEVIPSIQTLGHMGQYLKWPETAELQDTNAVLLCDSDQTYQFIESMIAAVREAFTTDKLFVGLDEAGGMGTGAYFRKHGYRDKLEIFERHTKVVTQLCKKYGFWPMMFSDMYFKMNAKDAGDYGKDVVLPKETLEKLPDATLTYWDYCGFDVEHYTKLMREHKRMNRPLAFLGGNWTWLEAMPDFDLTMQTAIPAMQACIAEEFETVLLSAWGDDGAVTDYFAATFQLAVLSEHCYLGKACTQEEIYDMGSFVSGASYNEMMAMTQYTAPRGSGKAFLYGDMLLNLTHNFKLIPEQLDKFRSGLAVLKNSQNQSPFWQLYFKYAILIFEICIAKGEVILKEQEAYNTRDRQYFTELADRILPEIAAKYEELNEVHSRIWLANYKPFGWEIINGRYGWLKERVLYYQKLAAAYGKGETDCIEELTSEFVDREYFIETTFTKCVSPGYIS